MICRDHLRQALVKCSLCPPALALLPRLQKKADPPAVGKGSLYTLSPLPFISLGRSTIPLSLLLPSLRGAQAAFRVSGYSIVLSHLRRSFQLSLTCLSF